MTRCSAISVYNNLTACQTCITVRSANYKTSCRIDKDFGFIIHHFTVNNCINHVFSDIGMNLFLCYIRIMLCGNNDRLKANRLTVFIILNRNLALAVCAQIRQRAVLTNFCQFPGQLVCK